MPFIALPVLTLLLASLVASGHRISPAAAASPQRTGTAQQLFLDPMTGLPRAPTEAELAALRTTSGGSAKEALRANGGIVEEIHLPDGTGGIRLDPANYHSIQVCLKDGQGPAVECEGTNP